VLDRFIKPIALNVENVFFYGAGCGHHIKATEVKHAIVTSLNVKVCEVAGDISHLIYNNLIEADLFHLFFYSFNYLFFIAACTRNSDHIP
jgi:hypothetical protein